MEWDVSSFGNEEANEWLKLLINSLTTDPIANAIETVHGNDHFIDAQDGERAVAAAEVVAASRGCPSNDFPPAALMWLKAQQYMAPDELLDKSVGVVERISKKSELRDLWDGTEAIKPWLALVADLKTRLQESYKTQVKNPPQLASDTTRGVSADVESILNEAITLVSQGNHQAAIGKFNQIVEQDPGYIIGYIGRATSYLALGHFDSALEDLNAAINMAPEISEAYYLRAQAHFQMSSYGPAIADLSILIKMTPNRGDAYVIRGLSNAALKRHEQAVDDFSTALEIDPENMVIYLHRAKSYEKLGRFDLAGKDNKHYERKVGGRPLL